MLRYVSQFTEILLHRFNKKSSWLYLLMLVNMRMRKLCAQKNYGTVFSKEVIERMCEWFVYVNPYDML